SCAFRLILWRRAPPIGALPAENSDPWTLEPGGPLSGPVRPLMRTTHFICLFDERRHVSSGPMTISPRRGDLAAGWDFLLAPLAVNLWNSPIHPRQARQSGRRSFGAGRDCGMARLSLAGCDERGHTHPLGDRAGRPAGSRETPAPGLRGPARAGGPPIIA